MTGILATRSPNVMGPFPAESRRPLTFEWADISAIGKLRRYNDNLVRFIVRLRDGSEVFVKANAQTEVDCARLYKLGKQIKTSGYPTRDAPVILAWLELVVS